MKVLFLDHDGVICLPNNWGSRYKKQKRWEKKYGSTPVNKMDVFHRFDSFDKKAIDVLNEIISITDLEIVISSDWRLYCTLEEMQKFYMKEGVIKSPIAFAPVFKDIKDVPEDFPWKMSICLEQQRSFEIKTFLKDNPKITNWVAVDDLDMRSSEWGLQNFVICDRESEGIKKSNIKEKIISFL
jgi:hypothetical protein